VCISDDGSSDRKTGDPADHELQTGKKALAEMVDSAKALKSSGFTPIFRRAED
jgi:hypothetical protein